MDAEQVAVTPECVECGETWLPADPARWRLVEVDLDEHAFYCPE
jgi:hypothetical protein